MSNINISMDVSDVVAKTAAMLNLTSQQADAFAKSAKAIQQYDEQLNKTVTTVTGSISAFQKLTASFENLNSGGGIGQGVSARLQDMNKQLVDAATRSNAFESALKRVTGTLTNLALYRGFNEIIHSIEGAISNAMHFQEQVARIQAASQGASQSAGQWSQQIRNVSNALGVEFKDAAEAAHAAIQSQLVSGGGVEGFIKTVGQLSKVTGSTMKESGDTLTTFMNAFGHTAEDAETDAAKLFKTTTLGKAQIGDLGKAFAQTAEQAKILGVSEDELLASFAILSRDLGAGKAAQSLSTAFGKLIQPDKAVKEALGGRSLANGMTGIQDVFKTIDQLKGQGFSEFDIFGGTRAIKSIHEITSAGQEYNKVLQQIHNSQAQFNNAKGIVSDTDADKIKRLGEILKNALADTVGNKILSLVSSFSTLGDVAATSTQQLESGAKNVVSAMAGVIGVVVAATAAWKVYAIATAAASAAGGWKSLLLTPGPAAIAAAGPLAYLGGKELFGDHDPRKDSSVLGVDQTVKDLQATREQSSEIDKLKQGWAEASRVVDSQYQKSIDNVNKRIQALSDSAKQFKEALSSAFTGALNKGKEELAEIQHKIEEIIGAQRNAGKLGASSKEHTQKVQEAAMQEFADPLQHVDIQQQDINRTWQEIQKLSKDGSGEAAKRIDELGRHIQDVFTQSWSYAQKEQQKYFEAQQKENAKNGMPYETTFFADSSLLLQGNLQIENQIAAAKKAQNEAAKQQLAILEGQKKAKEEQLASQQKLIHDYINFSAVNEKGELKTEYKTPAGQLNEQKLMSDFQSLQDRVGKELKPTDIQGSINLEKLMAEQKQRVQADVGLQSQRQSLLSGQQQNSERLQQQKDQLDQSRQKAQESNQSARDAANAIERIGKAISNAQSGEALHTRLGNLFGSQGKADNERALEANAQEIDRVLTRIHELSTNRDLMTKGPGGQQYVDVAALQDQKRILQQLLEKAPATNKDANIPGTNTSWNDAMGALKLLDDKLKDSAQAQQDSKNAIVGSAVDLNNFQAGIKNFSVAADNTSQKLDSLSMSANNAASALNSIKEMMKFTPNPNVAQLQSGAQNDITNSAPQQVITPPSPQDIFIPPGQPKFYGGPLYREYGGPIGEDSIPMFGSRGEMVMNAAATSRYYTQLMGQNIGSRIPQRFDTGGVVNQTNNINISGVKSAESTAYQIDMALKRAKRLGTIN